MIISFVFNHTLQETIKSVQLEEVKQVANLNMHIVMMEFAGVLESSLGLEDTAEVRDLISLMCNLLTWRNYCISLSATT